VLVLADADRLGVNFDQFGERILQPARDGDGPADGQVEVGKLLAGDVGGGVNVQIYWLLGGYLVDRDAMAYSALSNRCVCNLNACHLFDKCHDGGVVQITLPLVHESDLWKIRRFE